MNHTGRWLLALALLAPSPSSPAPHTAPQDGGATAAAETCPAEWLCDRDYFRADVVFVGRVTRVTRRARAKGRSRRGSRVAASPKVVAITFAVERSFRGLGAEVTEVEAEAAESDVASDAGLRVGETYLVRADAGYSTKTLDLSTLRLSPAVPPRLASESREEIACMEERGRRRPSAGGPRPYVLSGKSISRPAPAYPAEAKAARVAGTVTVVLTVDEAGKVSEAEAVCGHPLLREAAREAALRARYSPILMRGRAVKVQTVVAYNFVLDD